MPCIVDCSAINLKCPCKPLCWLLSTCKIVYEENNKRQKRVFSICGCLRPAGGQKYSHMEYKSRIFLPFPAVRDQKSNITNENHMHTSRNDFITQMKMSKPAKPCITSKFKNFQFSESKTCNRRTKML